MKRSKWMWRVPGAILAVIAFIAIGGEVVMLLWNWLLPMLFGWRQITFWQALGVLALCRILFGGLGRHGVPRSGLRRGMRERMTAGSESMTPEERERFRQGLRGRCGFEPPTSESKA